MEDECASRTLLKVVAFASLDLSTRFTIFFGLRPPSVINVSLSLQKHLSYPL